MADLVDYLRDKLEHADDVTCTCPDVDITTLDDLKALRGPQTMKGYDPRCPEQGRGSR